MRITVMTSATDGEALAEAVRTLTAQLSPSDVPVVDVQEQGGQFGRINRWEKR